MLKYIFYLYFLIGYIPAQAQTVVYNQTDAKGKANGQWIIKHPARMGEPAYSEWGTFVHGLKWGAWFQFDWDAQVTCIEHFRNGVLDGEAKYFENGVLVCVGNYRGLNPRYEYDTIVVVDPVTDAELTRIFPTDRGTFKQGLWRYYDPVTGRLQRELDYQLDEVVYRQDFSITPIDSVYYKKREAAMPHNQKHYYKPPRDKQYTNLH